MILMLALGGLMVAFTMSIQIFFVVLLMRYLSRVIAHRNWESRDVQFDMVVISCVMLLLFFGHIIQISAWALLFIKLGEFDQFITAVYHSAVNFSSLGYGDMVMSERWRSLGAIEAGSGVLMFGLSTGVILSVMNRLFEFRNPNRLAGRQEG